MLNCADSSFSDRGPFERKGLRSNMAASAFFSRYSSVALTEAVTASRDDALTDHNLRHCSNSAAPPDISSSSMFMSMLRFCFAVNRNLTFSVYEARSALMESYALRSRLPTIKLFWATTTTVGSEGLPLKMFCTYDMSMYESLRDKINKRGMHHEAKNGKEGGSL